MKSTRTWVLIADGAHARLLERSGASVKPLAGLSFAIELPASRDILTDRPGRSFESQGRARHAKANPTDPHRELKRAFAKKIAGVLAARLADKQYDELVVVAPPVTLGDLRSALPRSVRDKVTAELAHDLIKTPQSQLPRHLAKVLPGKLGPTAVPTRRKVATRRSRKSPA